MDTNQIRRAFIDFFVERDHTYRPSASLIPVDPTLLLINAGMAPFKPFFLGEEAPPYPRAVSTQKCVRTVDIDIIGTTARHMSFFEMMGNFSFGDYFKEKAIPWSYEFSTEVLGFDPERLWFTVHESDDEAAEIWIDDVGVDPNRVQRRDRDNFWQMGVPGPCGPASELFFDRGPEWGPEGGPVVDEERFIEFWNLVFMQNIQDEPYHVVGDLPARSIDTGAGLERVAMLSQHVNTVFHTDSVHHVLEAAAGHVGLEFGADDRTDVSLRLMADHGRAVSLLIGDGVLPSNEGRGYVLRRLMRRVVRHAWQYGTEEPVLPVLVEATLETLGDAYPDLIDRHGFLREVTEREEARFRRTLASGSAMLDEALDALDDESLLSGTVAFKLHDTYGFPIELTEEVASERGVEVDRSGFEDEMAEQQARAREAWKGSHASAAMDVYRAVQDQVGPSEFLGYSAHTAEATVVAILHDGVSVPRAEVGDSVEVILDKTPFYAEAGGQVGDVGIIRTPTGQFDVFDTQAIVSGLNSHRGDVGEGHMEVGQPASAAIDSPRRDRIARSHTGTHILHAALRQTVGDHVHQAGSLVEDGRLRFDFNHFSGLGEDEIATLEARTNEWIIANSRVETVETTKDEAEAMGALAFFGDKYGEQVRVVKIGDYSTEFCGGTHTPSAGQVGPLVLISEGSVGANVRRVEALTGEAGYERVATMRRELTETGRRLKVPPLEVSSRVEALLDRVGELETQLGTFSDQARSADAAQLAASAHAVGDQSLVVTNRDDLRPDELRELAVAVRDRIGSGVVLLGSSLGGKAALIATATDDVVAGGMSAGAILADVAAVVGGGGSRDPQLAQAGGPGGDKVGDALELGQRLFADALAGE